MWTLVLSDLAGVELGEITDAADRSVQRTLGGGGTGTFRVRNDHPLALDLIEGDRLVKFYEGTDLRLNGELATVEERISPDANSIVCNVADGWWRAGGNGEPALLLGKTQAGQAYGTVTVPVDRISIVNSIWTDYDVLDRIGLGLDAVGPTSLTYVGYPTPWYFKPIAEAVSEIGNAFDGYEFKIIPTELDNPTSPLLQTGTLYIRDTIGIEQAHTVFELGYGSKSNVAGITRAVDRGKMANTAFALPPDHPLTAAVSATDAASIALRGDFEAVVENDLASADLRQRLVDEHVAVRKQPRQIITFEPALDTGYEFEVDFDLGDTVPLRAKVDDEVRIDVAARIYRATFDIDANNNTRLSLTTIPGEG